MKAEAPLSRRTFLKNSAALSAVALVAPTGQFFAAGSDTLRIALIGCGDRGTGAVQDCFNGTRGVEIVALADVFQDQIDACLKKIKEQHSDRCKVTPATCFTGFEAYRQVLAMREVDIVLLATPPAFRPLMVHAAVESGKHIFMEKPGCVDPVGARSLIQSAEAADQSRLSIVVGTQQRYQPQYQEILKRIHAGELGQIVGGQAYWNWGFTDWHYQKRQPAWSDLEWQLRCWPYFVWLSGDHIVEQHLHNMDILNWAIGSPPESCVGFGGRQARTTPDYGNIYDHFVVEFQYPGDVRVMSMCSQIKGSNIRIGERVVGSKGTSWTTRQGGFIEGAKPYNYEGTPPSGMEAEHAALVESIRNSKPINECQRLAESTLTLIMGRYAAYTGQRINWNWITTASELDLMPKQALKLGPMPVAPVAVPGQVELI
jgi:predicted dehydrogenase